MIPTNEKNIPEELRAVDQWVLWKITKRDGKDTKIPCQINGAMAKSNDPETWSDFETCLKRFALGSWEGLGFVFSAEDPYCGIDLDGCRNPETGVIEQWAKEIILDINSYAEVSPSQTGVKIWVRGNWPFAGHKIELDVPKVSDKTPAIEVYDSVRYFAVTGQRLQGMRVIGERQEHLDSLRKKFWKETVAAPSPSQDWRSEPSVMDRAEKYLAKMPVSVSGQNGSGAAFHAACVLVQGFDLPPNQAMGLMRIWNQGCQPPWSERELQHKIDDAAKLIGERGYLRNASPQRYDRIQLPDYTKRRKQGDELDAPEIKVSTLKDSANEYLHRVASGEIKMLDLGLPELDFALGGGVEAGEMIIFAARPSHGKSMGALQIIHNFTAWGIPSLIVTEEMSSLALGKRAIQFASPVNEKQWAEQSKSVGADLETHFRDRAPCYIAEDSRTVERASDVIREHVSEKRVGLVVVDYIQQLAKSDKKGYDEVTRVSRILKQTAKDCQVPMIVLSQLNRAIESRPKFLPQMSDLKESGQLEQDADVIVFQVWPWKIDPTQPPDQYKLYIGKNRNRGIMKHLVICNLDAARQTLKVQTQPMDDAPSFDPSTINWESDPL
jgi:replicative DNA helicase